MSGENLKQEQVRQDLILQLISRDRIIRRGTIHLSGKEFDTSDQYADWVSRKIRPEDSQYGTILIKVAGKSDLANGLRFLYGRINYHLVRLLEKGRTPTEQRFAQAIIDYGPSWYCAIEQSSQFLNYLRNMNGTVNYENDTVTLWWTIAPYIFQRLTQEGMTPRVSITHVLNWAVQNDATVNDNKVALPGLEWVPTRDYKFILSSDITNSPWSHTMAHKLAEYITPEVKKFTTPVFPEGLCS